MFNIPLIALMTATTITKKYQRAKREQQTSQEYFEGISQAAPEGLIPQWTAAIEEAERNRQQDLTAMDIMRNQVPKCLSSVDYSLYSLIHR